MTLTARLPRSGAASAATAVLLAGALLTGCGGSGGSSGSAMTPTPSSTPAPTGLGGGAGESGSTSPSRSTLLTTPHPTLSVAAKADEIDKPCPYAGLDAMRDAEGDRTNRSVELKSAGGTPVGCRYYFEYDAAVVIAEVRIQRFGTPTEAFNAIVDLARTHPEFVENKSIGDFGSVTLKLPLQGTSTWACLFSKGNLAITAHTRQTVVSQDARNVATLIAPNVH
ncbi:hypothetical protein M6D93_00880 [Jatrophihabitans telluris]|uniref:DUF3558 domain-containing protein n=1 Tax=Jatrophihabitans telluris TaxID=2038343 RepID=A0ABY4R6N2_9ACTN|nr:hypothetical protein [Jatrophihabitans telluris]UQX90360.1 hypothetical protein M6D93_00880 [Jatrophihabitans telluris]